MRKKIIEGEATLIQNIANIVSKDLEVFYNPTMELNRTLSILLLQAHKKNNLQIALPLAGSGVRAVRFLIELPQEKIKSIEVNDYNHQATELFKENLSLNNISDEKVIVHNKDANEFLTQSKGFDYIDIDPFGSPNFLLDSSIARLARGGILAVSATDTAALAGTYPKTCIFKYWSKSALCPQKHEMGLRILIRKVQLLGMQNEKALQPILSYHDQHYYRVFFICKKSKEESVALFDSLDHYFIYCPHCGFTQSNEEKIIICPRCEKECRLCGPLYSGKLQDKNILETMITFSSDEKNKLLLSRLIEDDSLGILGSVDTHDVASKQEYKVEKIQEYINRLQEKGFSAVRSIYPNTGIKTNAEFENCLEVFVKKL